MQIQRHSLPSSTPGTQRELVSLHYGPPRSPAGGQKVYIQASLHADELPGMLTAWHLRKRLDDLEAQGLLKAEIVLVPMANPIGLSQWLLHGPQGRFDLLSGENFNRHYANLSEQVAQAAEPHLGQDAAQNTQVLRAAMRDALAALPAETELAALRKTLMQLAWDADVVLDLHCDNQAVMHLYTLTPSWPACEPLARFLGARVTLLAEESGDNPFDEACSQSWLQWQRRFGDRFPIEQACLSVTVELRSQVDVDHALAEQDAQALIDFLCWRGLVDSSEGTRPELPPLVGDARPLAGCMPITCPRGGLLTFLKPAGAEVKAGEVLAHLIDPISASCTELTSPVDGIMFRRDTLRFVSAGAKVANVAGTQPLRTGKLLGA